MESNVNANQFDFILSIQKMNAEMVEIQTLILSIINEKESVNQLLDILHKNQFFKDENKFHDFLYLLNALSYSRKKIKEKNIINDIMLDLKTQIIQTFSKKEIFLIFNNNIKILQCLLENHIIDLDILLSKNSYLYRFFLPEYIQNFGIERSRELLGTVVDEYKDNLDQFCINRKECHSDLEVAKLIRSDDLDSFIEYTSRTNMSLDANIPYSVFEIDYDMHCSNITLIEYAAIFESIKIFKYLFENIATYLYNILLAVVSGGNFEILHIFENKGIKLEYDALHRSVAKHRNEMFDYIMSKYSIEYDFSLIIESVRSNNYYVFNKLLNKNPEYLTNIIHLNDLFFDVCACDIRVLFEILYLIPDINVNVEGEILFIYFVSFEVFIFIYFHSDSPLHFAARYDNVYIVKKLLKHPKININSCDYVFNLD